jgi:serine/threonine protein phosphatase PrpC
VRLQEKLCKARTLVQIVQKQAEEARQERDKEHRRAEGLQLTVQTLQRQLKRETTRSHLLERSINSARGDTTVTRALPAAKTCGDTAEDHAPKESFAVQSRDQARNEKQSAMVDKAVDSESEGRSVSLTDPAAGNGTRRQQAPPSSQVDLADRMDVSLISDSDDRSWEFVVQGQHDAGVQEDFAGKLVSCFPDDAMARAQKRGVSFVCSRGRRLDAGVPNQDDFLVARHTLGNGGHIALYGVFDGHGPAGHHCASFARQALPESLFVQHTLLLSPEDTLRSAFEQAQRDLLQQPFDTETSGTTAALALVLNIVGLASEEETPEEIGSQYVNTETWLYVAHVGDSRVALAQMRDQAASAGQRRLASTHEPISSSISVAALTRDHRPDNVDEAERVRQQGGEIRRMKNNSGAYRVYEKLSDQPALALTRTLGASRASTCGVSAVPEITSHRLTPGVDVLLLLGTDGLFEFFNHSDAATRLVQDNFRSEALEDICEESRQQWFRSSYNETVDDITAVAVSLQSSLSAS